MDKGIKVREKVIDAYRGVAIVLMMIQHAGLYFLTDLDSVEYVLVVIFSRLSMPMFLVIAGFCVSMTYDLKVNEFNRKKYLGNLIKRVAVLFVFGTLVNLAQYLGSLGPSALDHLSYAQSEMFKAFTYINVIHMIWMAILMCGFIRLSNDRRPLYIVFFMFLLLGLLNIEKVSHLGEISFCNVLKWLFLSGEYAFGQWSIYALLGVIAHDIYKVPPPAGNRLVSMGEGLILGGMMLYIVGFSGDLMTNGLSFMALITGFMLILYHLIFFFSKNNPTAPLIVGLAAFGRHSLSIYVVHQYLFISIPKVAGFANSGSLFTSVVIFIAFIIWAYASIRYIEAKRGYFPRYV